MTARADFDRQLTTWLVDERPTMAPEGLLDEVIDRVAATPRRPGWQVADRWFWTRAASRAATVIRASLVAAVVVLLLLAIIAAVILVGSPRPAPPFGLTTAGLIAFDAAEGVVVSRADGSDRRVVSGGAGQAASPTWSRDGLHLAFWQHDRPGTPWNLVVFDPGRDSFQTLATNVTLRGREAVFGWPSNIAWSPDSRRIAFAGDVDQWTSGIYVSELGSAGATLIADPALNAIDPAWAPDGAEIAYQSGRDFTLHLVAPDGSGDHALRQPQRSELWPDWSPDGTRIATMAWVGPQYDIYVVSRNGSIARNVSRNRAEGETRRPGHQTARSSRGPGSHLTAPRAAGS